MNWKIIFNPFTKFSEIQLLISGIIITFLGSFIGSYFGVTYDGVLDVHAYENTFWSSLTENLINIFSVIAVLFLLGKIINTKSRFIDILNTGLLGRFPIYLIALVTNNPKLDSITQKIVENIDNPENMQLLAGEMVVLTLFTIFSLLMLAYFIVLHVFGFKTATNLKKWQHWILFGIAIILAEIISKSLFTLLFS